MRECGNCSLCCHIFSINDPPNPATGFKGLVKAKGEACVHLTVKGCGIYHEKGPVCNNYKCLWLAEFLPEWMKPNEIGVVFDRFEKNKNKMVMIGWPTKSLEEIEPIMEKVCDMGASARLQTVDKYRKTVSYDPLSNSQEAVNKQKMVQANIRRFQASKQNNQSKACNGGNCNL